MFPENTFISGFDIVDLKIPLGVDSLPFSMKPRGRQRNLWGLFLQRPQTGPQCLKKSCLRSFLLMALSRVESLNLLLWRRATFDFNAKLGHAFRKRERWFSKSCGDAVGS